MGNHDYYPYLDKPHILGDYGVYENMFFVRGAWSIDHYFRTLGRDLFHNEQLSYVECQQAIDLYEQIKPNIVISHDCPIEARQKLFYIYDTDITSTCLQTMLEIHRPSLWVFGHHHKSKKVSIQGTEFICLNELETLKI